MSDLISRSVLIKKLESMSSDNDVRNNSHQFTYKELSYIICNQPTAYDVEKVVEELEDIKKAVSGCFGTMCSECKYTEECYEGEKDYKVAIDKAIDIVKRGGREWQR